jgi:hypothetical protein
VQLVAFDENGQVELVHIHTGDPAPNLFGDFQQYFWFTFIC